MRNPETGNRKETAKPHIVMLSRDPKGSGSRKKGPGPFAAPAWFGAKSAGTPDAGKVQSRKVQSREEPFHEILL
jgi:hypothetical protein